MAAQMEGDTSKRHLLRPLKEKQRKSPVGFMLKREADACLVF
jgi:hypothetical protein